MTGQKFGTLREFREESQRRALDARDKSWARRQDRVHQRKTDLRREALQTLTNRGVVVGSKIILIHRSTGASSLCEVTRIGTSPDDVLSFKIIASDAPVRPKEYLTAAEFKYCRFLCEGDTHFASREKRARAAQAIKDTAQAEVEALKAKRDAERESAIQRKTEDVHRFMHDVQKQGLEVGCEVMTPQGEATVVAHNVKTKKVVTRVAGTSGLRAFFISELAKI